jgi:hypothetical protein
MAAQLNGTRKFMPAPWGRVIDLYVLVALFCAFVAAVRTLEAPSLPRFAHWLVVTECVGVVAVTCGSLVGRIPWLQRFGPLAAHLMIGSVAVPVGFVVGNVVAYTMLDQPIAIFQEGPRRVIALITLAFAAAFVIYLDVTRQRHEAEAAARSEAQRLAVEAQLRLLRAQLEPHMLFNTLANLRSLVESDNRLAQAMIDQLIVYLRSALAASREESTTLRNEFAQLRAYLEIMSLRMGPRLSYRLELPDSLQLTAIPPMLLQPLVENAIKHGLEPKIGNGSIEIRASDAHGAVEISVTDSGLGLPGEEEAEIAASNEMAFHVAHGSGHQGSYGLVHVRERLKAFYGPRASLTLSRHQPQGVRALVRIPA